MKYTVVWKPAAEQELIRLWTDAADRAAVSAAANSIDEALASKPAQQGESRRAVTRILFLRPLGVLYDVMEADRQVSVLKVWRV
jgi:plasmid stabilization system protein ParE